MLNIDIRKGVANDFPALAGIISSSKAWTCFGIDYNIALNLFEKMEDTIYVAENDSKIIGFITISINGVGNIGAYIRMVAVTEKFRGQGIGQQLINYAGRIAAENIPNLFLICSVENIDAQRFYEKMGFVRVGILNDLVIPGHDEILYRKSYGTLR
jgi:ribosomal protein S18 acetylase RimI-like enzyme